jgi:uncharacterized protein YlxW (UPF0749 family)
MNPEGRADAALFLSALLPAGCLNQGRFFTMSVFTSQIRNKPFTGSITILAVVLGGLLALSLKEQNRIRQQQLPSTRLPQLASAYGELRDTAAEQNKQIGDLRRSLAKYQQAADKEGQTTKLLQADLLKANVMSGLTAVTGPGVVVTLSDSKKQPPPREGYSPQEYQQILEAFLIHDQDIQIVLNELNAAGAEAIAVNNQRLVSVTAVRCVGPVVLINNIPTSPPVRITAIGDPDTLAGGLTMTGGVRDKFAESGDPSMIRIDKVKASTLTIPAFNGSVALRFAKPATDAKAEQAQQQSEEAAKTNQAE